MARSHRDAASLRLDRLRGWRNRRERDLSLGFLKKYAKQHIERPFKQFGDLTALWQEKVPAPLQEHTRLDRLSRGVLHVSVDSSAHLYELDRLLRSGLERELIQNHRGPAFRRVKLSVANLE